ncbi:hypothetical protein [Levilactobacillus brevis]|uniref:hypothetical protein n=1 Tax=Lactobacillaceae TaxID=33958 RepID=UPI003EBC6DBC
MRKNHYYYLLFLAALGFGLFSVNIKAPSASAHVKYTVVPKSLRGTYYHYFKKDRKWSRIKMTKYTYKAGNNSTLSGKKIIGKLYPQLAVAKEGSYYLLYHGGSDYFVGWYKRITITKNGKKIRALKELVSYPGIKHDYTRIWYPSKIKFTQIPVVYV